MQFEICSFKEPSEIVKSNDIYKWITSTEVTNWFEKNLTLVVSKSDMKRLLCSLAMVLIEEPKKDHTIPLSNGRSYTAIGVNAVTLTLWLVRRDKNVILAPNCPVTFKRWKKSQVTRSKGFSC